MWKLLVASRRCSEKLATSAIPVSISNRNRSLVSIRAMASYSEAINALNSLQTNAKVLEKVRKERQKNVHMNLPTTVKYLERSGMTLEDLDTLKIVHVSGTKGKGSTCAFSESILRSHGLRTGFYSSPHLVSATERIRLDGNPINQALFTHYFWMVYDSVCRGYTDEDRPPYFQFLTILAFNVFWREGIDVAVVEVGIGGAYDCTNIVRNPLVTGITALGLDHTSLLGNTINDIAWHKAGIMKEGVQCFTDSHQQFSALDVLKTRASQLGSELAVVPDLTQHKHRGQLLKIGLYGEVQKHNASLAIALATFALAKIRKESVPSLLKCQEDYLPCFAPCEVTSSTARGLEGTVWPGRSQVVDRGSVVYFLDGAHTEESMTACTSWFQYSSKMAARNTPGKNFRVLLFNSTGDRDPRTLLQPLSKVNFDLVVFCSNKARSVERVDQQNFTTNERQQNSRSVEQIRIWTKLQNDLLPSFINPKVTVPSINIPCINDALVWLTQGRDDNLIEDAPLISNQQEPFLPPELLKASQVQILVTGSLHLVGGFLGCIEPSLLEDDQTSNLKLNQSFPTISNSTLTTQKAVRQF